MGVNIESDLEYQVKIMQGCHVIYGDIPLDDLHIISQLGGPYAVSDFALAKLMGAQAVFGRADMLSNLRAALNTQPPVHVSGKSVEEERLAA